MVLGHLCVAWRGILEELGKGDVAGWQAICFLSVRMPIKMLG